MKRKINLKSILNSIIFLFSLTGFSQKVDTVLYEGKKCYVYPFSIDVNADETYYNSVNKKKYLKLIVPYYKKTIWKNYSEDECLYATFDLEDLLNSYYNGDRRRNRIKNLFSFIYKSRLKKMVRKNPFLFLEQEYEMNMDLQPCLDAIPDGKYIQYFTPLGLINRHKDITVFDKKIAGIFTIKNNALEGEAVWLNFKGDTIKKGFFKNGLKEGIWSLETRELRYGNRVLLKEFHKNENSLTDTTIIKTTFQKGVKQGVYSKKDRSDYPLYEGFYTENKASGHWIERIAEKKKSLYIKEEVQEDLKNLQHNKVITEECTYKKDNIAVKQPIIRNGLLVTTRFVKDYNFYSDYEVHDILKNFYTINFKVEADLDLDLEKVNSYEGEENLEQYNRSYDSYEARNSNFSNFIYDKSTKKYHLRGKLIDSLGVIFKYDGVYEKRYPNGQLIFHYEFNNGKLLKEDTVFWDNGKPLDVINFVKDSNQYVRSVYDYDGKLYYELVYDSLGDFVRVNSDPLKKKYIFLEGLKVENDPSLSLFKFDNRDSIAYTILSDSILLWKSWDKKDTCPMFERIYFPKERILINNGYSMTKNLYYSRELVFSENFESWTGVKYSQFNGLTSKSILSASKKKFIKDTLTQSVANDPFADFDITTKNILHLVDTPVSGSVSLSFGHRRPKFNTKNGLDFSFPNSSKFSSKLKRDFKKYKKKGNSKYVNYWNTLNYFDLTNNYSNSIYESLFPFLSENTIFAKSKSIKGTLKDGVPTGIWTIKKSSGTKIEVPFLNGELNGTVTLYSTVFPGKNRYYDDEDQLLKDTFPKRKTEYISTIKNYKNGLLNGEYTEYDWLGNITKHIIYSNDFENGPSYERNNLAHTKMNYSDGVLDGYLQTYLTFPGKDSILLYSLNFQNGLLQGESKSYHLNGKLSKRGFFLNGDAIDDYEAYDTLGFKFHYVKFLYSFPVEEKIWEENQLSVRYLFDWKDSIVFEPTDITSSQSLDKMLSKLKIGTELFEKPYFGRPSLVNKKGINYHMTKYYPNDTIARDGEISNGKKIGLWKHYSYEGEFLYEVNYFDSIIQLNDSIQFKSKGIHTDYDSKGKMISKSYVIEKFEKYDCSHTDHYEIRQLYTFWQASDTLKKINGYVKNHYDNGVLQNEGYMVNGLPSGVWKFYDPFGKLNQVGKYVLGKRDGRWLGGDLGKTKYLGDICLNPNLPDLEEEIKTREKQLNIVITNYKLGKALNNEYYDIDWSKIEK